MISYGVGSFKFNGIESSTFKLVCKSVNRSLLPAVKLRRIEMPGMSGVYDLDANGVDYEYEIRTITMLIQYIGTSYTELRTRAREIAAWLNTQGFAQLIINDETDKYYLAKVTGEINLDTMCESGSAEISFDCQPFAYSVAEVINNYGAINAPATKTTTNPGTRTINYKSPPGSRLYITATGSWTTLSFGMNGTVMIYNEAAVNKTLNIDSILMEVLLDNVNKFSAISAGYETFLKVVPGLQDFEISGTGLNLSAVQLRYIPLWL